MPLTVLQFMKKHWQEVQKLSKEEKVTSLLNSDTKLAVPSPQNSTKAVTRKPTETVQPEQEMPSFDEDHFIQQVPVEVL